LADRTGGPQTIEASYLTAGMNWRADYVLLVNADDTKADLQGWVTLTNASGATFEDARLQLVAGAVNRVSESGTTHSPAPCKEKRWTTSRNPEQGFFEYHLYTLQRPTSIRDNETKQVSLLEAAGFEVTKEFVLNGQHYYYTNYNNPGQPIKEKVGVYVQFRNAQAEQTRNAATWRDYSTLQEGRQGESAIHR